MKRVNIRNLALSFILILSLTLGVGCELLPEIEISPPQVKTSPPGPPATSNTTALDPEWTPPSTESQAPILPSIADAVAKVKPSVVAITTEVVTFDIFNRPFTQEGAGSGWIISEDGYIVTNNHVIEGAKNITIKLDDGSTFPAAIVGTDPLIDLAVIKITAPNLPAATVGDSGKSRVGDWVVAIGNSLGQGIRATQGIISRQDVKIEVGQGQTLSGLIETDAAINPGNSGGPLVNMAGDVIGITSVKIAQVGVEGVGFAISSDEAMPIIQQLINTGYVVRPWLGVSLYSVDQFVVSRYELAVDKGTFIVNVARGSPADRAGLKAGDVITKFGEQEITEVDKLIRAIHTSQVGQQVEVTFWRGDTENTTYVTLTESPPPS